MKLIVISSPQHLGREAETINQLFDAGLEIFHLRKPESSQNQVKALLYQINSSHHGKIALHQYHDLKNEFDITRLHFTESARKTLDENKMRLLKKERCILSASAHQCNDLEKMGSFDYSFLSPVFNSISKPGYQASSFPDLPKSARPRLIALGGIDHKSIPLIKNMGFEGAAVLGAIWLNPEKALENFTQLQDLCRGLAHM